ncbi:MAG: YuiB family protein [Firmicutes bacterium]|uniref:Putative membrane protein n=1 Tax=Melghirimyces thermohalophilus TaxID=1236220 RepID=A0A1G6L6Q6_9BACL|nr:YuiB family protein [Melghirimyces thermohalophilus]MDA8353738.1 YuiB family protein [Bacillota bacterium]SDC39009.1 Putative membrane protein [Melghirimyces thermohalophilus]
MSLPQIIISVPLFGFMGFGISFILNMILKTTWFPLILYAGVLIYCFLNFDLKGGDYLMLSIGLAGILGGAWAIQTLRKKGYRMF